MCRMLGVVSQGPVYYDLFEEFADLATQGMCPLGAPDGRGHEDGMIDSQVLFAAMLDQLKGRSHKDVAEATAAVRTLAIEKYGGFTGLNFMLTDGANLHVYRDFQTNGQYYTLYIDNFGEMVVASSEPILAMKAEPMPRGVVHSIDANMNVQRTTVA